MGRDIHRAAYVNDSDAPLEFKEPLRFGSANVDTTADVYLAIVRDSGKIGLCGPEERDKLAPKEVKSAVHYKYDSYWDGSDLVFPQFGSDLQNGAGESVDDITECEIYNAGCFPFVLHYDDGTHDLEFPSSNQEWQAPRFSAALNNRSVTFNWPYYTVQPDRQAWQDAVRDECERIVTDAPGDWRQGRPAYDGVFADVVEWTLPGWINILEPGDYDAVSYGPGMEAVCSAAQAGMGAGKTLLINGFDQQFLGNVDVDRFYVDGLVKDQENVRWTDSYVNRADACRSLVLDSMQSGQPVTLRSQAGIIYDDQTGNTRLYRMMDLLFYWLVTEDNVDPSLVPSLSYAGSSIYDDRTMSFPESQIRLQPDGAGIYTSSYPWEAVRSFNQEEAFIIYNHDDYFSPGASLQAGAVLSAHGYSATGDWYKMVLPDTLTTTEGGRIEFVECDLNTEVIDPAHGLLIMKHPPVLPRILDDAYSPVWLAGGEPELEVKVMHPDTTTIVLCEVSIHELKGLAEPETATMYGITDDGLGADDVSGDGVYTLDLTTEIGAMTPGEYEVWVYAEDDNGYYQYSRVAVSVVSDVPAVVYSDTEDNTGIVQESEPYSSVAIDVNQDGREDILISIQDDRSVLYAWEYDDVGLGIPVYGDATQVVFGTTAFYTAEDCRGITMGDFDNDGQDDLFVAHASNRILLKGDSGDFIDAVVTGFPSTEAANSWAGVWGDVNGDGWLDLYISRALQDPQGKDFLDADAVADRLMLGVDGASFVSSNIFTGVHLDEQPSFAASFSDVDLDGDLDIFIPASNAVGSSAGARFYTYTGGMEYEIFQDAREEWFQGVNFSGATSAAWADLNNDGLMDLVLSRIGGKDPMEPARPYILTRNDTSDGFTLEVEALPDLDLPTWDVRPLDFDLDGWMDLLLIPAKLATGDPDRKPKLFRNSGVQEPLKFEDVSDVSGMADLATEINGAAIADYDLDGAPDLFLGRPTTPDAGYYFLSHHSDRNWVKVRLEGAEDIQANRSGLGAQVRVVDPATGLILAGAQQYGGGAGRGSEASRWLIFGLDDRSSNVEVVTRWQNGFEQVDVVAVNQSIVVEDRTPPDIVLDSFTITLGHGTEEMYWDFEWTSKYLLAESVDQVEITGPGTGWNPVVLTPQTATYVVDGKEYGFYGFATDCVPGPYTVVLTTSANGQSQSTKKYHRVRACLVGF